MNSHEKLEHHDYKNDSQTSILLSRIQEGISTIFDTPKENGIIMIKPSGMSTIIDGVPLKSIIEKIIFISELDIIREHSMLLTEKHVNLLYDYPTPEDRQKDIYKQLVQHLTSGPIHSYYLEGNAAIEKSRIIKRQIREVLWGNGIKEYIKNWLHSAEKYETEKNFSVLFNIK